ncbi:hypothetical protein RND71_025791 [Anisodus tanguticus]|uniref:Uncharacterized protein n=1 Tax=Anisodus tanguticus TaxID=243964 RepID=A0AAE1RMQ1_9SOLA|nr:hypothetical protein RND71_025791 [Anisodus tanguticus]
MARLLLCSATTSLTTFLSSHPQGLRSLFGASDQLCYFSSRAKKKSNSDGSDSGEENLSKKDLALKQALDQITTSFGKGSIMWLGRTASPKQVPVVSTGSFSLDIALGIGRLPKGRVIEIYGPEASGKTTLALHVIAEAQKQGACSQSNIGDDHWSKYCKLTSTQPDCGEQALSLVDTIVRSGSVDVVVDSVRQLETVGSVTFRVAAFVSKGELEGEMGDAHMAMQARLMSQALRKLSHSLSLSQTILIFINQARVIGCLGPSKVTCDGNALKFYASVRLNIKRIGLVKKGEETIGSQVLVKIVKNKHAPPFRTAEFELEFGKGISLEAELIDLGVNISSLQKVVAVIIVSTIRAFVVEML